MSTRLKEEVFFGEKGLTSTSANTYANLAKEMQASQEAKLKNMRFYKTTLGLIGSPEKEVISKAMSSKEIASIPQLIHNIDQLKQLQAWLREAIKAKQQLQTYYSRYNINNWAQENGIEMPKMAEPCHVLTEDEYIGQMSESERARYYKLETTCSTIGKYIHPDNTFARARATLMDKLNNPHSVDGNGRDTIIYNYEVEDGVKEQVEAIFFQLQKEHRDAQKQLNSMKFEMEEAIWASEEHADKTDRENRDKYSAEIESVSIKFKAWQNEQLNKVKNLKIIVPNSLASIFDKVKEQSK